MGKPDQELAAAEGARRATGGATGRGRGGRFSVGRKREVVLRLLRGEDLESVSRELGITAARATRHGSRLGTCRVYSWRGSAPKRYERNTASWCSAGRCTSSCSGSGWRIGAGGYTGSGRGSRIR